MTSRPPFALAPLLLLFAFLSALAPRLAAQADLVWSTGPGAQTWSTVHGSWYSPSTGVEDISWPNGSHATFANTSFAANITIAESGVTVGNITFSSNTTTIAGGTLTLSPTSTLSVATGATASISAPIAGTGASLTKTGPATLSLSGANTYTGGTTISQGTLFLSTSGTLGSGLLTLSGGTLSIAGSGTRTFANAVSVTSASTITTSGPVTLTGALSGSGGLTKGGSSALILSENPDFTGGLTLTTGTLTASSSTSFGSGLLTITGGTLRTAVSGLTLTNSIALNGSVTVSGPSGTVTTFSGNVAVDATRSLSVASGVTAEFSGVISGAGGLSNSQAGTLILSGNNTYAGGTTPSAGTLVVGHNSALGTGTLTLGGSTVLMAGGNARTLANALTITGNPTIGGAHDLTLNGALTVDSPRPVTVTNTGLTTFGGVISGAGAIIKSGTGTLLLSGNSLNTGQTSLSAGTLALGHDNALGTGTLYFSGGTLQASDSARTLANPITFTGAVTFAGSLALTFNGAANLGTATRTVTVNNSALTTFAAVISNTGGLTKSGPGALLLSAENTYTGATTINAGLLSVNGSLTSGSTVTVNNTGTLGGTGTIGGATTIASGGTLAPGSSPGVLKFSSALTLATGSTTTFEINGTDRGTTYDGINVTGLTTYGGTLNLVFGSTIAGDSTLDLFQLSTTTGNFDFVTGSGTYAGSFINNSGTWTLSSGGQTLSFSQSTGDLTVSTSAIPEPSTYAALAGLLTLAIAVIRKRRSK